MTAAELAILSLIVQTPRYGYQIEQVIQERGMRDWAEISFSSIYYLLGKLEGKGWIASERDRGRRAGPARKVYRATRQGTKAWRRGVLDVLSSPRRHGTPLLVGLANLPGLSAGQAVAALLLYARRLEAREAYVRKNRAAARAKGPLPWHVRSMFDLSLTMTRAETSWVKKLARTLASSRKGGPHA